MTFVNHPEVLLMLKVKVALNEIRLFKSKAAGMMYEIKLGVVEQSATLQPELEPIRELGKQKSVPDSHNLHSQLDVDVR